MSRDQRMRDEIERLRDLIGVQPDTSGEREIAPQDEVLLARVLAGPTTESRHPARIRRPVGSWIPARIAVACVTVLALVVGYLAFQSGQAPALAAPAMLRFSSASVAEVIAGTAPNARGVLEHLARTASAIEPVDGAGTQQIQSYAWFMAATVDTGGHKTAELAPTFQTISVDPDGALTNRQIRGPALSLDGRVIGPDHYPAGGASSTDRTPPGTQDPGYPATLPRDPSALRATFVASQGGPDLCLASDQATAQCLYTGIVDLFTRWVVPSDLAASMWQVFADSAVVVDMGTTTDRLGREGHAVALPPDRDGANQVLILIIDPDDGQLLSWEQVSVSAPDLDQPNPFVSGFQAILSSRWVAE